MHRKEESQPRIAHTPERLSLHNVFLVSFDCQNVSEALTKKCRSSPLLPEEIRLRRCDAGAIDPSQGHE